MPPRIRSTTGTPTSVRSSSDSSSSLTAASSTTWASGVTSRSSATSALARSSGLAHDGAVSGGGGWLRSPGVPYLLAAAGVRLGGRVRLAVDVERSWYRVERTAYTAEYGDGRVVREISSEAQVAWPGGTGVRAGVELAFR